MLLRLMNGVYLQLHAYMLRIAIPYGTLSSAQLRMLAHVGCATTAVMAILPTWLNIQFHRIKLMICPTSWPISRARVRARHADQRQLRAYHHHRPTVLRRARRDRRSAHQRREYCASTRPCIRKFSFLPRKFKIAATASAHDRAAGAAHDIGLRYMHRNEAGEIGASRLIVGGGLLRTPFIGKTISPFLPKRDLELRRGDPAASTISAQSARQHLQGAHQDLVHELGAAVVRPGGRGRMAYPSRTARSSLDPAPSLPGRSRRGFATLITRRWRTALHSSRRRAPPTAAFRNGSTIRSPITRGPRAGRRS